MAYFINITRVASEETHSPDCQHINITNHISEGWDFPTQGQTQSGQSLRWEAVDVGNPAGDIHAEVGDYIRLESGVQKGEYRQVISVVSDNRVGLNAAWSVDQTAVDFSVIRSWKQVQQVETVDSLWSSDVSLQDAASRIVDVLTAVQAKAISDVPIGTRTQVVAKLNASPIDVRFE